MAILRILYLYDPIDIDKAIICILQRLGLLLNRHINQSSLNLFLVSLLHVFDLCQLVVALVLPHVGLSTLISELDFQVLDGFMHFDNFCLELLLLDV